MNILIVDDREDNRYLLEALLTGNGHEVAAAANGEEALAKLKSRPFELIISDILMPVMDGFELCRRVRADEALRHMPFIVYTATYTGPQDEAFALKIGADRFIQKPCEPDVFMAAVSEVMAAGSRETASKPPVQEEEILKLYNERLVRKLEQKMLQLEKEVSAKQEAEKILRQNEKKYRSLFNSLRDAILVTDTQRAILDCNPAFVDLFGYPAEEIRSQKSLMLYENEEGHGGLCAALKKYSGNSNFLYKVSFKKKSGDIFPGEVNVFNLYDDEGTLAGYIGVIRDLTERRQAEDTRKKLEDQLRQAQKMESVGRLAGGVAHDFNNMLSIILGYGEMVLEALPKDHPHQQALDNMVQAGHRAKDLTRQLLAFSRKQILEMRTVNLNAVTTGFQTLLRRVIGEDVELVLELASTPLLIKADAGQLEQVLMNLAVNARDAMPDGGTLTIETTGVELDDAYAETRPDVKSGTYAMICVSDTGFGMDRETLDRIFEPFFTTKDKDKGTGLGLATSYGIIKQHDGHIWVYSEPGQGTVFKIYLPRVAEEPFPDLRPGVKTVAPITGTATVLVVEDDPSVRKLACTILTHNGYRVIESVDAADAVDLAGKSKNPIDLVLSDVIMPGINGPEVCRRICEHHPGARVLYMSGYTNNVITHGGMLAPGVQFVQKPFGVRTLIEKVREVLAQPFDL
jgi:two-component system, cell cycle sensor histidine kinase and response regulator CckA